MMRKSLPNVTDWPMKHFPGSSIIFALIEFSWCDLGSATLLSESALVDFRQATARPLAYAI